MDMVVERTSQNMLHILTKVSVLKWIKGQVLEFNGKNLILPVIKKYKVKYK